uniref:Cytochrome b n=2 Tax=Pedicinus badii TaxID=430776 RepID=A0A7H1K1A6_9NEOP|nr:cytochrome b [Pedicinus badii]
MVFNKLNYVPIPSSITYSWNFGSLLGMFLMIQIFSGFLLATHYESSLELAFSSVLTLDRDVSWGWLFRSVHANGASWFFILLYLHIFRGLWFSSFSQPFVWLTGFMIYVVSMATAFMGYVLPWGQMSFWGATVITNLLSAIPVVGQTLVIWVWGGFSVANPTLLRFFSVHFILPFVIFVMVVAHLLFLHVNGSSNPLGLDPQSGKVYFYPYFFLKDLLGMMVVMVLFAELLVLSPDLFMDPDNFTEANPMVTPVHIQPEWYFLFAYAILRAVPSKLGGVVMLATSIIVLALMPLAGGWLNARLNYFHAIWMYILAVTFFLLTWLGTCPVEYPFIFASQLVSVLYFFIFISWPMIMKLGIIKFH